MRKFSASVTLMFRELPALERFAAAREAGFEKVEIQVLEAGPADMAREAQRAGVMVYLLNVGMGDFIKGGPGLIGVPGREAEFLDEVRTALSVAKAMDIPFLHLGPSRIPSDTTRSACMATLKGNLAAAIAMAHDYRGTLLLEPLNVADMPDVLMGNMDEAAAMIHAEFQDRLWLMFDIYHVVRNGRDVLASYRRHKDLIKHVQFSDVPGRHEPGTGGIDFAALFAAIEAEGYTGYFGAEYLPSRPTGETFSWVESLGGTK